MDKILIQLTDSLLSGHLPSPDFPCFVEGGEGSLTNRLTIELKDTELLYVRLCKVCLANLYDQPDLPKTLPKSLRVNQYTSSMTDMKLTPRQSPQMPPKLEMKSSQVIL